MTGGGESAPAARVEDDPAGLTDPAGPPDTAGVEGAVIWCDFGGVLTSSVTVAFTQLARAAAVPPDVLRRAIEQIATEHGLETLAPLELGLVSQREWGARVTAALAPDWVPAVDLGQLGDHFYAGRTPNTLLLAELARIRAAGTRVGLLTNSVREWEPLRQLLLPGMADVFERQIASHEVGLRKPDPAVFELAERAFGGVRGRFLLIDDLAENCAAADRRGWATIHHQSTAATVEAVAAFVRG